VDHPLFSLAHRPADEHLDYRALVAERTIPFAPAWRRSDAATGRRGEEAAATGTDGPRTRHAVPR